ncbi:MAG: hypothetical protein K2L09_01175 [Alistipes sp.]|nr:hypothetical protein [Alistipes sp.]
MFLMLASGYRHYTTGALTNVGANGDYWSSSPAAAGSANGSFLWFTAGNMHPLQSDSRANGLTVRCVQHLRAAFLEEKANGRHASSPSFGMPGRAFRNGT